MYFDLYLGISGTIRSSFLGFAVCAVRVLMLCGCISAFRCHPADVHVIEGCVCVHTDLSSASLNHVL